MIGLTIDPKIGNLKSKRAMIGQTKKTHGNKLRSLKKKSCRGMSLSILNGNE